MNLKLNLKKTKNKLHNFERNFQIKANSKSWLFLCPKATIHFMKTLILTCLFLITPAIAEDFISSEEAHRLVNKEKALLLDVRTLVEYKIKHIPGAKRIGVSEVPNKLAEIEKMAKGKDKPIVVYCLSGGRSGNAKKVLEAAGFKKVYNLGGIGNWKD